MECTVCATNKVKYKGRLTVNKLISATVTTSSTSTTQL